MLTFCNLILSNSHCHWNSQSKKWPLCLFCESFLSVQGRCSRALEGGAFCRDVVNLNFPKSRFRCTWAGCTNYQITQIPRHPSSIYQTRVSQSESILGGFLQCKGHTPTRSLLFHAKQNQKLPPVLVRLGKYLQVTRFIQYLSDLTNIYHVHHIH